MTGTLLDRPLVLVIAAASLVVVLGIGAWALGRTRDARDYFIAGQKLGLFVTGLAATSAAFSGFVFIGGPGLTYRIGAASLWIVVPVGFTAALMCWVVARPMRRLAGVREVFTIPDLVGLRFPGRAPRASAALAVLIGTIGYLGAQLLAFGFVLTLVLPETLSSPRVLAGAVIAGGAVVLAYSVAGGMVAGVYTDVAQGVVMVVAAVGVFAASLGATGGPVALGRAIAASPEFGPAFLDPFGMAPAATVLGFLFVFGVGPLGQPHVVSKFFMLRDERNLKWMPLVIGASQSLCLLVWIGVGFAVPALVAANRLAPLEHPDRALPVFLAGFAPDVLAGLVLAGVLAAIMSTADSFVNIGSAVLVRDLPRCLGRSPRRQLFWGRIAAVLVTAAAVTLALAYDDLVALLGTFAFGTFASALAPTLALGLSWRGATPVAATASIVTGLVTNLALELSNAGLGGSWLPAPPLAGGALPSSAALAASMLVFIVVGLATAPRRGEPLDPEVEACLDS